MQTSIMTGKDSGAHAHGIPATVRRVAVLVLGISAAAISVSAQPTVSDVPLRSAYRVQDGGQPRVLELALDELAVVEAGGGRSMVRVASAADAEGLRLAARVEQARTTKPVELILYPPGAPRTAYSRRYVTRQVLMRLDGISDAAAEAGRITGTKRVRAPDYASGYVIAEMDSPGDALAAAEVWRSIPGIALAEPMLARARAKKSVPNDPLFVDQWHLRNVGQLGGALHIDANLTPVWESFRGAGVVIGVVDDGIQYSHPDLVANYNTSMDWDFNSGDSDAAPADPAVDTHGTPVAGVVAARGNNSVGVAGVAYEAAITGLRLLGAEATDEQEAQAMAHSNSIIQVKHNSWGAFDDGATLDGPGPLTQAALENGVTNGRGGRGVIYVFSGGNGLDAADDSNKDGYANSIYAIAVGAVDDAGFQSYYSEPGANLIVSAPSGDGLAQAAISTTDITGNGGLNTLSTTGDYTDRDYTWNFSGTSASAPIVSGVAALMLEANPRLGWRDVQEILIASARRNHSADIDWISNGAGYRFNHKYGAGMVDAQAAVGLALLWTNLGAWCSIEKQTNLASAIPDNDSFGVTRTFAVATNNFRVERVAVTINAAHAYRGDLEVTLISPSGTGSRLVGQNFDGSAGYVDWTFTSVRHWGEWAAGNWVVRVADRAAGDAGTLNSVKLKLFGSVVSGPCLGAGGTVVLTESNLPTNGAVDPGEMVTVNIGLKNSGDAATTNLVATLLALGGVVSPAGAGNYGALASGATGWQPFSFKAEGACGAGVTALLSLQDGGRFLGVVSAPITLGRSRTTSLTSSTGITIHSSGDGTPTPSTITVAGLTGRVHRVTAQMNGVTHSWLNDISSTLVAPTDLQIVLQDAAVKGPVSGLDWTFDGEAPVFIPSAVATSGTYKPFDGFDLFSPSSPAGEIAYTLNEFCGLAPDGAWRLYLYDWQTPDSGGVANWALTLTTMDCTDNIYLEPSAHVVDETNGVVAVTVSRTGGCEGSATVNYATTNSTAQAGSDYSAASGTLTFAVGETVKTVNVSLLNDTAWENTETFGFRIWGAGGNATLGSVTSAVVTIHDGDGDGDGMPDDWETANGFNPGGPSDGSLDADLDGLSNVGEFLADCNPHQAASCLTFTDLRWSNGWPRVVWVGGSLARQWLECRTNLAAIGEAWQPVYTGEPPTPLTNWFLDTGHTNTILFYRIRAQRD